MYMAKGHGVRRREWIFLVVVYEAKKIESYIITKTTTHNALRRAQYMWIFTNVREYIEMYQHDRRERESV